jgi:hypothetical protein
VPDYSDFVGISENDARSVVMLRASSFTAILTALSSIEPRYKWSDGDNALTDVQYDEIDAILSGASNDLMDNFLVGTLYWTLADTLPVFVLPLDGDTHDKADFPALYDKLPASWKDSTTFTLPNWQGLMPVVVGGSFSLYDTGG